MRIIGAALLAVSALALSACSAIKLGYTNAPELTYWWLDGYVDFTDEQKPRAKADLARLHEWHRAQELPRLAALITSTQAMVQRDVTPAQVCTLVDQVRARMQAVADHAEPAMTTLVLGLVPEQLDTLRTKYARNNAKYRKEWVQLSPQARRDKTYSEVLDRVESVYGRLGSEQRDALRQQLATVAFDPNKALAERMRRQEDALATIGRMQAANGSLSEARNALHAYLERSLRSPDAALRQYQEDMLQQGCKVAATVHNTTTPEQRAQAVKRLGGYAQDVAELMAAR